MNGQGNRLRNPVTARRKAESVKGSITKTGTEVIAIDGKTVRRSYSKKSAQDPIHVVSAFAARQRLVLGQVKVEDKSNEIVAIPALLQLLYIEGAIITIDAMGAPSHAFREGGGLLPCRKRRPSEP